MPKASNSLPQQPLQVRVSAKPFTTHVFPTDTYRPEHIDAQDTLVFAAVRMKEYYDTKHKPIFFNVGDFVHLRLHRGYKIVGVQSKKLGQQFAGSFKVTERIGRLAYRLKLTPTMKIYDVISVVYLESATSSDSDPYERQSTVPSAVIVDNHKEYEIDRLIRKKERRYGRAK